ncbi:MAG TPA: response regulator [Aliidongia sp.]|uniref:response regulator n=1 Tax=Aliidongia sp. TaxID=1914230 RepID=UPI002DDDB56C|nr:response regulator [Aliidongia sp.]HEV2673765.1 response regulator [Aliidongia sp.]
MAPIERTDPAILVVEDDFLIRMAVGDALRDRGFAVVEASDAQEAVEILEQGPGVSVVFTDVRMPGAMDGFALAGWIAERYPAICTILTSGEIGSAQAPADFDWAGRFIRKPYRLHEVAERLQALVAG